MSKFIFFDIDGTLAGHSRDIVPETRLALARARLNGHKIFVCTGRTPASLVGPVTTIKFDGIVSGAGSFVEIDGEPIFEHYIERDLLSQVISLFDQHGVLYSLEGKNQVFQPQAMTKFFASNWEERIRNNPELARMHAAMNDPARRKPMEEFDIAKTGVAKLGFIAENRSQFAPCIPVLRENFNIVYFSKPEEAHLNGEIILRSCTKGDGVRRAVNYFRGSMEDTIGFGDSMNDYQMLEAVKTGAVFVDAPEPLKKLAQYFFKEPDDGGIRDTMAEMGLID